MSQESKTNWSGHVEWAALMVTIIGSVYVIDGKIDSQISEVRSEVNAQIFELRSESQAQIARTDRLYEMFIDLLREKHE